MSMNKISFYSIFLFLFIFLLIPVSFAPAPLNTTNGTITVNSPQGNLSDNVISGNVLTVTFSNPTTTTVASGGGSGSGGSSSGAEVGVSTYTSGEVDIKAGEAGEITITKADDYGVSEILVEVTNNANNVKVVLNKYTGKPSEVVEDLTDTVHSYLKITLENLGNSNIESAKVKFKVEKTWLSTNNLDPATVLLNRYNNGKWEGLGTTMTGQDSNYYYYEAKTPGFSYFAITAKKLETVAVPVCGNGVCETGENYETCSADCPKPSETPSCGNGICETGENCGNCLGDCPCASGYSCQKNLCKEITEGGGKKFPLKVVTIIVLIFVTLAVIIWLVQSLKEEKSRK